MKLLGSLFNEGGIAEQASKMVDVFCVIETEIRRMQFKRK